MMLNSHVIVSRMLATLMLGVALAVMPGCFIMPLEPKDKGAATDRYRVEMEYLPGAQMVREDTSPTWELGRQAFIAGTDRIIVIGRTTSYADKDEDGKPLPGTDRDRKLERVWITIKSDIPLGKALRVEDLELEYQTGYDVNNLDSKGFFNGPALMKGYVNLVEEGPDKVVVIFDLEVRPNKPFQAENWKVEGKHTITVVPQGRIATAAVSRDVLVNEQPVVPPVPTPAVDGTTTPVTTPVLTPAPLTTPKDPGTEQPAVSAEPKKEVAKSIVGKWSYNTSDFDYRFQFGENGKFIYSTGRGDGAGDSYEALMIYGTYEIKRSKTSEWVVLVVDKGDINDAFKNDKTALLKLEWDGANPVMSVTHGMTRSSKSVRFALTPGDWEDMNKFLPPPGRRKNATPVPNPTPYW